MNRPDFTWTVDLFTDLDRPTFGRWFDLELSGNISEEGVPVVQGLQLLPKGPMSWPSSEYEGVLEPLTKQLLQEVLLNFDRYVDETAAAARDAGLVFPDAEFVLGFDDAGNFLHVRGSKYFTVAPDGTRSEYEPDESERSRLIQISVNPEQRRRVRERKWTDDRLRRVAAVYRQARASGQSTNQAIQAEFGVKEGTADVLVRKAKNAKLLPEVGPGRSPRS